MTTAVNTNQVDFGSVVKLIETIRSDPEAAQTRWTASVDWKGGFRTEARSRDLEPVGYDEPLTLGGSNTAPNPVEQILGALGSCLAIGYAANATARGIQIRDLRIELEGDLDLHTFLGLGDGNAGFSSIRAKVTLEADADPESIEALHRQVVATSPVGHTISRPVPVEVELA